MRGCKIYGGKVGKSWKKVAENRKKKKLKTGKPEKESLSETKEAILS